MNSLFKLFCVFVIFFNIVLAQAQTEPTAIANTTQIASWVYYTDTASSRWYISPYNTTAKVSIYSLGPITNGKASWWTVANGVAWIDSANKSITTDNNLDTSSSDSFKDIASNTTVVNPLIHSDRQKIQGSTVPIKWYFFQASNGRWYIINNPSSDGKSTVYLFASKNNVYDWQSVDTSGLSFSVINDKITVTAANGEVRISNVLFLSQKYQGCSSNYLCGFAAANMLSAYYHKVTPTVDFMKAMAKYAIGQECPQASSYLSDQAKALRDVGGISTAYATDNYSYLNLKSSIKQGIPVSVAIQYSQLNNSQFGDYRCANYNYGHSVVAVGYNETRGEWLIHDPLCTSESTGAYRVIPSTLFKAAGSALSGSADSIPAVLLGTAK